MRIIPRSAAGLDRAHASHWARPQRGELTYVALGDSAGVGVGVEDPRDGYVEIIARRFAAQAGKSVRTVNLSTSGARVADVSAEQLSRLESERAPDLVTCVVGGNDVAWSPVFRKNAFRRSVESIVDRLPAHAVVGLVPHFVHWPMTTRARAANQIIRDVTAQSGLAVADIASFSRRLPLRTYLSTFSRDFFHPNEAGYALWADAIWEGVIASGAILPTPSD